MGGWTGERLGINNMGKDIDRNITRQLWERLKNTFSRNDVIPVENGGTGETNSYDIIQSLTNNSKFIKIIQNTYRNDKINSVINATISINTNSIFVNFTGDYKVTNHVAGETLILAVFKNTRFMEKTSCNAVYGSAKAMVTLNKGTITISITPSRAITEVHTDNYKGFISFPI